MHRVYSLDMSKTYRFDISDEINPCRTERPRGGRRASRARVARGGEYALADLADTLDSIDVEISEADILWQCEDKDGAL